MKTEIKTLLVPTDFSPKAENALKVAAEMALRHHAKLIIVHIVHTFHLIDRGGKQVIGAKTVEENLENAHRALDEIQNKISSEYQLTVETYISVQNVIDTVNDFVDKLDIDLVVLGTSGQQTLKDFLVGSNSYNMLLYSNCSVLLIPENFIKTSFKNILFPVRVEHELEQKVKLSLLIANKNEGKIYLLGVGKPETIQSMKKVYGEINKKMFLNAIKYEADFKISEDSAEIISQEATEKNCDLILLADEDEDSWKSFLADNFFKKMINKTDIPLLFVKSKLKKITQSDVPLQNYDVTLPIPG